MRSVAILLLFNCQTSGHSNDAEALNSHRACICCDDFAPNDNPAVFVFKLPFHSIPPIIYQDSGNRCSVLCYSENLVRRYYNRF